MTFVDGDYHDRWCTKKVVNEFSLEGELILKSNVDVVIRTPRKLTFEDDGSIGLEGEIVEASTKTINNIDDFEHIIKHALSCTSEKEDHV